MDVQRHIEKYRPSNATEGDGFICGWCELCARYDDGCGIQLATMAHGVDEPEYPAEWCFDDAGLPQCTAFVHRGDPLPPKRCDRTPDMFGGDS